MTEEHAAARLGPSDAVAVLRAAAQVLRRAARDRPRGPWRWGNPEVGDESAADLTRDRESWPVLPPHRRPGPLEEPAPLGHPDPFAPVPLDLPPGPPVHPVPTAGLDPELAEPLSVLLDGLAGQVVRDVAKLDPETVAAAVAVARFVLHPSVPWAADSADHAQP